MSPLGRGLLFAVKLLHFSGRHTLLPLYNPYPMEFSAPNISAIFASVSHVYAHGCTRQCYVAGEHFTWISRSRGNPAKMCDGAAGNARGHIILANSASRGD